MDDDVTFEEVEPKVLELKRYRVLKDGKEAGFVVKWEGQMTIPLKGTRLIREGVRRPFWTYVTDNGMPAFRVKLGTRKDAVRWLIGLAP